MSKGSRESSYSKQGGDFIRLSRTAQYASQTSNMWQSLSKTMQFLERTQRRRQNSSAAMVERDRWWWTQEPGLEKKSPHLLNACNETVLFLTLFIHFFFHLELI